MNNSLLFCDFAQDEENPQIKGFIDDLNSYAQNNASQMYFIKAPLVGNTDRYEYKDAAVLLISKHKICFINFNENRSDDFEEYRDDFIEDIGYLSDKYEYRPEIGRPRVWKSRLIACKSFNEIDNIEDFLDDIKIEDSKEKRTIDYLISLLIGSINDINRTGGDVPETLLDEIKKNIILFDGNQSRFMYSNINQKRITIQGLAGTGKTELLLHKLKDLYVNNKDSRIVFTCYNNILANNMLKRVPDFFNFMKVDEQIEWNKRLWVMPSWGSKYDCNSGLYSYICSEYGISFRPYSYAYSFEIVCREAIDSIKQKKDFKPCFDYILVDESQDFSDAFFELCELVAKEKVYIAGDIFQDIYDRRIDSVVHSDFILNKCYRTDPKTLMFAHSIGMGLYEKPVIRWLEDDEWKACGYSVSRDNGKFSLSRAPIHRFEDIDLKEIKNIEVIESDCNTMDIVLSTIDEIRKVHPTVCPGDIAIVFLEGNDKENYTLADKLVVSIKNIYDWKAVKGYETKEFSNDEVFISNRNNIKGLEFPFVICIVNGRVSNDIDSRNTLYMMLTRSFISSYLIIENNGFMVNNSDFIKKYKEAADQIQHNECITVDEPDESEKKAQNQKLLIMANEKKKSLKEIVLSAISGYNFKDGVKKAIVDCVNESFKEKDGNMSDDDIYETAVNIASAFGEK